jgi:hypothetical protein
MDHVTTLSASDRASDCRGLAEQNVQSCCLGLHSEFLTFIPFNRVKACTKAQDVADNIPTKKHTDKAITRAHRLPHNVTPRLLETCIRDNISLLLLDVISPSFVLFVSIVLNEASQPMVVVQECMLFDFVGVGETRRRVVRCDTERESHTPDSCTWKFDRMNVYL